MWVRALILALALATVATAAPVRYEMAISVSPVGAISGEATVTGTAPADWPEAVFRLYPAALGPDRLAVTGAWVEGAEVRWESIEPTTVTVVLSATAGQTFSLTLRFSGQIPEFAQAGGYGSYARSTSTAVLSQAYPILAPWDGSWIAHPAFAWGDSIVVEVADYGLDLTVPEGWTVVASGIEAETAPGRYRIEGENLRELAFVLLRGYEVQTASVGGVEVRSFFRPEHRAAGQAALDITVEAIGVFAEHLGPHPFPELDVVSVPLRWAAGIEYPGLILAGEGYYGRYPQDPLFFPMIFAHEVAHQWWYAEVGNDQVAEPWVDEALATYTSGLYFATRSRLPEMLRYWEDAYNRAWARNQEATVASPLWAFPNGDGYGGIVYSGGALFFHAVRERMGDDAFFAALRRYREESRWKIASGDDLLAVLAADSPEPLDDLFQLWLGL
ncbi:MAG: M1 family metallopeptidase [Candidatus Bipolaricaulota bacterium]